MRTQTGRNNFETWDPTGASSEYLKYNLGVLEEGNYLQKTTNENQNIQNTDPEEKHNVASMIALWFCCFSTLIIFYCGRNLFNNHLCCYLQSRKGIN